MWMIYNLSRYRGKSSGDLLSHRSSSLVRKTEKIYVQVLITIKTTRQIMEFKVCCPSELSD